MNFLFQSIDVFQSFSLQISVDDNYPKIICIPCLHKLNNAYKFKKKCEKSAQILKNKVFSYALSNTSKNVLYFYYQISIFHRYYNLFFLEVCLVYNTNIPSIIIFF